MKALHFDIAYRTTGTQKAPAQAHVRYIMRAAGDAGEHAAYVTRSKGYVREDLIATGTGDLPDWAEGNPVQFFAESDRWERAGGRTATQITAALPRALSHAEQQAAVEMFVASQLGTKHAYVWGIHETVASDGGRYPHVHIAFSEREDRGQAQGPQQYFSQTHNPKDRRFNERSWPGTARQAWSDTLNVALENSGASERVSARSFEDQGISVHAVDYIPRKTLQRSQDKQAMLRGRNGHDDTAEMQYKRAQEWEQRKVTLGITPGMADAEMTQRIRQASRADIHAAWPVRALANTQDMSALEQAVQQSEARVQQITTVRQAEAHYVQHPEQLRTPAHRVLVNAVLHGEDEPVQGLRRKRLRDEEEQPRGRSHARSW